MKSAQQIAILLITISALSCRKDVKPMPDPDIAWRSVYVGDYHKGSEYVPGYPITCPGGPCAFIVESDECPTCITISTVKLAVAQAPVDVNAYVYDQSLIIPDQFFTIKYDQSVGATAHLLKTNGKAYFTNNSTSEIYIFLYVYYKYEDDEEFQFWHTMTSYLTRE